jgi:hypothetical protein
MNKKLGYMSEAGINFMRHMKVTDELSGVKATPAQRIELAEKMKHSPVVQLTYARKHKVI